MISAQRFVALICHAFLVPSTGEYWFIMLFWFPALVNVSSPYAGNQGSIINKSLDFTFFIQLLHCWLLQIFSLEIYYSRIEVSVSMEETNVQIQEAIIKALNNNNREKKNVIFHMEIYSLLGGFISVGVFSLIYNISNYHLLQRCIRIK